MEKELVEEEDTVVAGRGRAALIQHRAGINGNETSSFLLGERTNDAITI